MANCPKCGKKLRLYHWRPECPFCGVNMVYYNSNDRMLAETEVAEIEHAHSQPRIDRAKAAFFGSSPAIARIVLSALPIGALFLPLGGTASAAYNAIRIYQYISDAGFDSILDGAFSGNAAALSLLLLLFSAVLILVCLICLPMSLGRHGKARNLILNLLLFGSAAASAVAFVVYGGRLMIGAFVYLFLLLAILVYNLVLAKKGLKIKYTVCYIGGLPSEEYFKMMEDGVSELEIRKKMVEALTVMQNEARAKEAREEAEALQKRAEHK
ncbi:MAG: hypothetical protein IJT44_09525 [Clostridia bacterium]|nr:hypothetical protein [Clostridia bacterium]